MNKTILQIFLIAQVTMIAACAPKVGSEKWCTVMQEKSKGDWTVNEAKDFTRHCLFK